MCGELLQHEMRIGRHIRNAGDPANFDPLFRYLGIRKKQTCSEVALRARGLHSSYRNRRLGPIDAAQSDVIKLRPRSHDHMARRGHGLAGRLVRVLRDTPSPQRRHRFHHPLRLGAAVRKTEPRREPVSYRLGTAGKNTAKPGGAQAFRYSIVSALPGP